MIITADRFDHPHCDWRYEAGGDGRLYVVCGCCRTVMWAATSSAVEVEDDPDEVVEDPDEDILDGYVSSLRAVGLWDDEDEGQRRVGPKIFDISY